MIAVLCVALNPALDQTVHVPHLSLGSVQRAQGLHVEAGGKALNVASCLSDFGISCALTGCLGQENAGPFEALMARKGIADRFWRIPGATRTNLKLVDAEKRETTDINLPGIQLTEDEAQASLSHVMAAMAEFPEASWIVLSGSLPPGMPEDAYARLIVHARRLGRRVLLDASGAALAKAAFSGAEILKPNGQELSDLVGWALGTMNEMREAGRKILAQQGAPRLLAISMGSEGALFMDANQCLLAEPLTIEVQSTVGAGDAMVAGILAAQCQGLDLVGCAQLATAFAAATLERLGPHLPERERLLAMAKRVQSCRFIIGQ